MELPSADNTAATSGNARHRQPDLQPEVSVAVADPSGPAGHWAERNGHDLYRRPGRPSPLPRPPGDDTIAASAPGIQDTGVLYLDFSDANDQTTRSGAAADLVEQRSRHWTNVGSPTLRPPTSDRGEALPPAVPNDPDGRRPDSRGPNSQRGTGQRPDGDNSASAVPAARSTRGGARGAARVTTRTGFGQRDEHGDGRRGQDVPEAASPSEVATGPGVLGGPGREIRAHRAAGREQAPRRRRAVRVAVLIGLALVLAAAAAAVAVTGSYRDLTSVLRNGAGGDVRHTVSAPLAGRTTATFEMLAATSLLTLRSEDLGADLYRVTTPPDSGVLPQAVLDSDRVRLFLGAAGNSSGADAGGPVEVSLNARVAWALRLGGGSQELRVDLGRGPVSGVELAGAVNRVDLTLPAPRDTVNLQVAGTVDDLVVHAPKDTPVRLRLDSGAKTVVAGENTERDVAPGSTFTPRGWDTENRYDVQITGKATLITVDNGQR